MTGIRVSLLILAGLLVVHLIEEIRTDFRRRLPVGEISRNVFVGTNAIIYTYVLATIWLAFRESGAALPMIWIFAVGMTLNGVGHISLMIIKRGYFPGGVTGAVIFPVAVYLIYLLAGYGG